MRIRPTMFALIVAGLATTSCSSIARDAIVEAYETAGEDRGQKLACQVEAKTLETASEAFLEETGASPQSFEDLVPRYIVEAPENWGVTPDGAVSDLFSPLPDGPCDGIEVTATTDNDDSIGQIAVDAITDSRAFNCTYDQRVLDVAIETYLAFNDMNPTSIDDLVQFGLIDDQGERWIVEPPDTDGDPSTVAPAPGGDCDA